MTTFSLKRYAETTWLPPFPQSLPSSVDDFVRTTTPWRAARRRFMRELKMAWHGQRPLLRTRIDTTSDRRILWIHHGTPQVGDSLTDLAARVLLHNRVERLDLLTDAHLLQLYRSDQVFSNVAANPDELAGPYDLVLLHSASSRSVGAKFSHYRDTPFAHVHGYFTGPEFNRTLFGYYRIAQLLNLPLSESEANQIACPSMWASPTEEAAIATLNLPPDAIAVAIGGVQDWRTYLQWPEVLTRLHAAGVSRPVVLIGSDNGLTMRDAILAQGSALPLIHDRVAKHTLGEVQELMRRCALVVCADGGLLHLAHTTKVPVVTLFAGIIEPSFRLTSANLTRWLYGPQWVNDVKAADLAACIMETISDL